MPIDASTMSRWRKRIGPESLTELLKESVEAAFTTGTAKRERCAANANDHV